MNNRKKTIKYTNSHGHTDKASYEEIREKIDNGVVSKLLHHSLSDELLDDISKIYDEIWEVLPHCTIAKISTLEQFELFFMREFDPQNTVKIFEKIVKTYKRAVLKYGSMLKTRIKIMTIILFIIYDALSEEEMQDSQVKYILNLYRG